ncbi:MAG: hypothetical protein JWN70_1236 [Planctomycetaceae bacterium]|nr:hypothetical protein [Planctomycetaceae bacterium]
MKPGGGGLFVAELAKSSARIGEIPRSLGNFGYIDLPPIWRKVGWQTSALADIFMGGTES